MPIFRCIKCRHKVHFAKDLLEHMHSEDHMDEPFVHCPQCKAAFEMEKIQSHYEECVSNTFTKCKWCDKIFSGTSGGLDIHRKKDHGWGVFRCPGCKVKEYFAEDLINHMNQEGHLANPSVNCPHCKNDFAMEEIAPHYKDCVSGGWKLKKCAKCKKSFTKEEIQSHEENCTAESPKKRAKREPKSEGDYNENGGRELQGTTCNICRTTFQTYPQMNYHRRESSTDTHFPNP